MQDRRRYIASSDLDPVVRIQPDACTKPPRSEISTDRRPPDWHPSISPTLSALKAKAPSLSSSRPSIPCSSHRHSAAKPPVHGRVVEMPRVQPDEQPSPQYRSLLELSASRTMHVVWQILSEPLGIRHGDQTRGKQYLHQRLRAAAASGRPGTQSCSILSPLAAILILDCHLLFF